MLEERHRHTQNVCDALERIDLRFAEVVLVPRQRRLSDSRPFSQVGLRETPRSPDRLKDLTERNHCCSVPSARWSRPLPSRPCFFTRSR